MTEQRYEAVRAVIADGRTVSEVASQWCISLNIGDQSMTRYQRVVWHHEPNDYPTILFSEVSDEGRELRKIDQYADGHFDFADSGRSTGSTVLSEKTMPSLDEIAAQPEFTPQAITAEEFESVWRRAVR